MNAERIAENEALFRDLNETLEVESGAFRRDQEQGAFLCECANLDCLDRITMTQREYKQLRSDSRQFAVRPAHRDPSVEHVVVSETPEFVVVRKEGQAGRLAEELEMRS